jgi:hypothetical protein
MTPETLRTPERLSLTFTASIVSASSCTCGGLNPAARSRGGTVSVSGSSSFGRFASSVAESAPFPSAGGSLRGAGAGGGAAATVTGGFARWMPRALAIGLTTRSISDSFGASGATGGAGGAPARSSSS